MKTITAGASPTDGAAVVRDVQILQTLAAPLTSVVNSQIHDTFVATFAQGAPTPARQSALVTGLDALLGPTATPGRLSAVNRLANDAPAFYRGVGSSSANVETLAGDAEALVNDGFGASLDPFKVTISGRGGV